MTRRRLIHCSIGCFIAILIALTLFLSNSAFAADDFTHGTIAVPTATIVRLGS